MAKEILMQKGTALWLAQRTRLSNKQIAQFCNMHEIEINAFKIGLHHNIVPINPIDSFLLSQEMIKECEDDFTKALKAVSLNNDIKKARKNRSYAKKHEIINGIFWLIMKHPSLPDEAIVKLLKTTKTLVKSIRDKEYKDYENLVPRHPVILELCSQEDLEKITNKYSA